MLSHLPESVDKELFGDVVFAVGVLKGEVELVVAVKHPEAVLGLRPRTPLRAAAPVYVHLNNTLLDETLMNHVQKMEFM